MEEKTMMPINNQIEPDFLEHIKSIFKWWGDLNTQGVTIRARGLNNFVFTLKGAFMDSHLGFKYSFNPRGTDIDGSPTIALKLYTKPEQMNPAADRPVCEFAAPYMVQGAAVQKARECSMIQKLKEEVMTATSRELDRANEQFPLFTSKYEGVAAAYKELEESKEAPEGLEASPKCLWDDVRKKETPRYLKEEIALLKIADCAINFACEAVQTAAIPMKYETSLNLTTERGGE